VTPRARALAVLVFVFLAGAAAGVGLAPLVRPPPREGVPDILRELDLTPDQETEARRIIDAHGPEVEKVLADALPRLRAIHEQVERELRVILSDSQRRELDRLKASRPPPRLLEPRPGAPP
jgi:hypothetical protein